MSSKRDLVEAHSFNRRRLVTAFVSGAPGGREVEPVRYARALVAGAVLAALVVVGAAVGGLIKPKLQDGWNQNALVIAKDSGARFFAQKNTLFPIINTTSARLIAADSSGKLKISTVDDKLLGDMGVSFTIGIPGAPDALPTDADLLQTGWTACVNGSGGLKVSIDDRAPARAVDDQALLVESVGEGGERFLVAGGRRYPISGRNGDNTLRTLGLPTNAFQASGSWVNLLDLGPEIKPFQVPGQGQVVDTGIPGVDRVGTPIIQGGSQYLLVTVSGKPGLLPLSDFAYAVYQAGSTVQPAKPSAAELAKLPNVGRVKGLEFLATWPQQAPTPYRQSAPCLVLDGSGDFRTTSLATAGSDRLPDAKTQAVTVRPGHGALVQETSGGVRSDQGGAVLIDSTGTRFTVPPGAVGRLGYGSVATPSVSQAWTVLFTDGPALDPEQAIKPATGGSS